MQKLKRKHFYTSIQIFRNCREKKKVADPLSTAFTQMMNQNLTHYNIAF